MIRPIALCTCLLALLVAIGLLAVGMTGIAAAIIAVANTSALALQIMRQREA